MMYTGGATESPKGAILTHNNIVHHMVRSNIWVNAKMGETVILSAFPMFHQAGNFLSVWTMSIGSSQVFIPNLRDLQFIISAIRKFRSTRIVNVPTIYLELMKLPEFRALDFSGIKHFTSGASPFPAKTSEILKGWLDGGHGLTTFLIDSLSLVLTKGQGKCHPCLFTTYPF